MAKKTAKITVKVETPTKDVLVKQGTYLIPGKAEDIIYILRAIVWKAWVLVDMPQNDPVTFEMSYETEKCDVFINGETTVGSLTDEALAPRTEDKEQSTSTVGATTETKIEEKRKSPETAGEIKSIVQNKIPVDRPTYEQILTFIEQVVTNEPTKPAVAIYCDATVAGKLGKNGFTLSTTPYFDKMDCTIRMYLVSW